MDSRSIKQDEKVKEWNEKFATNDVTLFPQEPQTPKGITLNYDLSNFHSEVESEKLDLERTKHKWEEKYAEIQKQDEIDRSSKQRLSVNRSVSHQNNNNIVHHESAIDREIRLAKEREEELRRDHGALATPPVVVQRPAEIESRTSIIEREVQQQQHRESQYHQEIPRQKIVRNKVSFD